MVANVTKHDHTRLDERDDMQHIQTQRLMAMRVIAPPKSRLGKLIQDRLAQLYDEYGESLDPAKRRDLTVQGANRGAVTERDPLSTQLAPRNGGMGGLPGGGIAEAAGVVGAGPLGATANFGIPAIESGKKIPRIPVGKSSAPTPKIKIKDPAKEQSQPSWVWMLSQLLKTDLKRLGLEPDELDDIRILLIKNEATQFDKLQLLSRLPDSLAPEAVTKIFEDIRTMAAGYVAFVLVERAKSRQNQGDEPEEDLKQLAEVPRSLSSPFFGIPIIDFDPEDILRKID
jgi:hypothetical protein